MRDRSHLLADSDRRGSSRPYFNSFADPDHCGARHIDSQDMTRPLYGGTGMNTHYCTICGAELDDQAGFDPAAGYHICTECGMLLLDPKYTGESARFGDIGWFCDGCGAFLNRQEGFTDLRESWRCIECGRVNPIREEEIYGSEEEYQGYRDTRYLIAGFFNEPDTVFSISYEVNEE